MALPVHYRALTAVCNDWNDLREQFELVLPVGEEIVGLTGKAAPQPLADTMDRRSRTVPWLPGGAEQVFLPGPINPLSVYKVNLW